MIFFRSAALFFVAMVSSGCMANNTDKSFQLFWTEFRTAAIQNDYEQLEKFTKFPLAINGVDDSIPVEYFQKKDFKTIFNRLMEQKIYASHGDEYILTNMMDVVSKSEIPLNAKNGEEYQVEQLVFEYINGQWCFTRAYLEE